MPVTFEQVMAHLDREEPDYERSAQLGPDALPHLLRVIQEGDPSLASKATYLAAFIDAEQSAAAIQAAANSQEPLLRIAAAGALRRLSRIPEKVASRLLEDAHVGVRHFTLLALDEKPVPALEPAVRRIAQEDPETALRELARQVIEKSH